MKQCLHHIKHSSLVGLLFIVLTSCGTDEEFGLTSIRNFEVFANDTTNNVRLFDMALTDRGIMLAGVCGVNRLNSKFDGDGRLFLMEVGFNGEILQSETCSERLFESGYPGKLARTSSPNIYRMFWNEFNGSLKSTLITGDGNIDSLSIESLDCNGCRIDNSFFNGSHYYTIGIKEFQGNTFTSVHEFDESLFNSRGVSDILFDIEELGGFGINDLTFLNRITNFLHVDPNNQRILFSGPINDIMVLSHIGEIIPEYSDQNNWVADIHTSPTQPGLFSLLISDVSQAQSISIFIPEIDLSGLSGDSDLVSELETDPVTFQSLDQNLPQFILEINVNRWVIVGTSINGLPTTISIENGVARRDIIGSGNRLEVSSALVRNNTIYISGTTILNNRFQKPFLISLNEADLFN